MGGDQTTVNSINTNDQDMAIGGIDKPVTIAQQSSKSRYCMNSFSCTSSKNRHENNVCSKRPDVMGGEQTTVNSINTNDQDMAIGGEDQNHNLTLEVSKITCPLCNSSFSQVSSRNFHMRRSC